MEKTPLNEPLVPSVEIDGNDEKTSRNIAERLKPASVDRASDKAELQLSKYALDGFDNEGLSLLSPSDLSKIVDSRISNGRTKVRTDATIRLAGATSRLVGAGVAAFVAVSGVYGLKAMRDSLKPSVVPPAVAQPVPKATSEKPTTLPPKSNRGLKKQSRGP